MVTPRRWPIAVLPFLPREEGSSLLASPKAGLGGAASWKCRSSLRDTLVSGCPSLPGHPRPIWVLLRDRLGRLSPSHYWPGIRLHMCVPVWVPIPGSCLQAGTGLGTLDL